MLPQRSAGFSPSETARYTFEMLKSLRKLALNQNQTLLAHLRSLAAVEAKSQAEDQDTPLPG